MPPKASLNALTESSTLTVSPGIKPLAVANAPADIKLRACVMGLNTVFANCETPLGYRIKLL